MADRLERLIKAVYKRWRSGHVRVHDTHPDEEAWACFLEGRLGQQESRDLEEHLLSCDICAEAFAIQLRLGPEQGKNVPKELLERMKNLVIGQGKAPILEICIAFKEKALEIIHTTGDILVGQEFVPAPVLRSRQIKDFKDEVTILKDFKNIRVELKLERKVGEVFDLSVFVKDKQTHRVIKDLRVTLFKEDLELESYLSDSEKVIFEHVLAGKYTIEISNPESKIASVLLDIKK
ncbi:MAG: hypothetical protein PHC54_00015 [Candidatus Omnitrophica bacterium]|nr:hypothetical protein [Candidatus Omnitrophota bacterium]MDD5592040.1 hypothetical protein [Candidatus Omnitrophota bacterium]